MSDASLKYVVIGETSGAAMDEIMAVYPRRVVHDPPVGRRPPRLNDQ